MLSHGQHALDDGKTKEFIAKNQICIPIFALSACRKLTLQAENLKVSRRELSCPPKNMRLKN